MISIKSFVYYLVFFSSFMYNKTVLNNICNLYFSYRHFLYKKIADKISNMTVSMQ